MSRGESDDRDTRTEGSAPPQNGHGLSDRDVKQLPAGEDQKLLAPPGAPAEPAQAPPPKAPPPPQRRGGRRWLWILLAGLATIAALFWFVRGKTPAPAAAGKNGKGAAKGRGPQGAAITAAQSKTGNMNVYLEALGTVTPINTITLYSQVTGQVVAVHYREGQMVKKGDPLIDIDPRPYETLLLQAEGTLQHDEGLLQQARMDLARYQAAWDRNAIAKQQLDDQAALVVQYEGTVKADQGTVAYDRVELSYCHIVSPITGRAGLRLVDPGNTVFSGSNSTLVVITQLQPITVVFNVSEDDLPQVQAQLRGGRSLEVDAFDRAGEKEIEAGRLTSLDNEVDTTTGTIKFRGEFPNRNLALFPNQFVNAWLLVKTLRNVTLVPSAAVQHNGTNAFVYIIDPGNKVSVHQITTLTSDDQNTAVQGLNAGANVATSGFDRLENGAEVIVHGQSPQQNNQGHGSTQGAGGTTATGNTTP